MGTPVPETLLRLVAELNTLCEEFNSEASVESKAAWQRARKKTFEIEKKLKEYRKTSVKV